MIVVSFLRYQKLEQERVQTEHQFHMQRMALENDRRREEREHEMNMLRMIMGPQPLSSFTLPNVHSQYLGYPQRFLVMMPVQVAHIAVTLKGTNKFIIHCRCFWRCPKLFVSFIQNTLQH